MLAALCAVAFASGALAPAPVLAQSTSRAKPITPLNPPGQANTPSGYDLLQRPGNDAHNPGMDPARKRRGSVIREPRLKGLLDEDKLDKRF